MDSLNHIPGLDGLRFIAFLLVFFFHQNFKYGWYGVDLFFVISGFLITKILINTPLDSHNLKVFYLRRALRILPLYYLFIFIIWMLGAYEGGEIWVFAMLSHTTNLVTAAHSTWYLPNHLWSLALEEQFYLFWPLICSALTLPSLRLMCLYIVLFCFLGRPLAWAFNFHPTSIYSVPFLRIDTLALGALISIGNRADCGLLYILDKYALALLFFSSAAILFFTEGNVVFDHGVFWPLIGYSLVTLSAASVVMLTLKSSVLQRVLDTPFLRFSGKISYGLYLWSPLVALFIDTAIKNSKLTINPLCEVMVTLAFSYGVSVISWVYFERAFLSLKKKFRYSLKS